MVPGVPVLQAAPRPEEALAVLKPYEGEVNLRPVGKFVSNVNHEGPECLDDAEPSWDEAPPQQTLGL